MKFKSRTERETKNVKEYMKKKYANVERVFSNNQLQYGAADPRWQYKQHKPKAAAPKRKYKRRSLSPPAPDPKQKSLFDYREHFGKKRMLPSRYSSTMSESEAE